MATPLCYALKLFELNLKLHQQRRGSPPPRHKMEVSQPIRKVMSGNYIPSAFETYMKWWSLCAPMKYLLPTPLKLVLCLPAPYPLTFF